MGLQLDGILQRLAMKKDPLPESGESTELMQVPLQASHVFYLLDRYAHFFAGEPSDLQHLAGELKLEADPNLDPVVAVVAVVAVAAAAGG